ncbi:hypothetical protein C4544_06250 [candidate division WS5 bacterium]|uniref:Uncharacterized protein n=1 Tax=candidate division WS5 bacterium TaxID=2093353 RepID=A0A419D9Z8_9BACT|nr:MAG: hypothetical protein C4544_06250 [candidate division WS5 bacterium]
MKMQPRKKSNGSKGSVRVGAIIVVILLVTLVCASYALATGYSTGKGTTQSTNTGASGTKGAGRAYVAGLNAHDVALHAGYNEDMGLKFQKLEQDKRNEQLVAELAAGCKPCPIVYLPAPDPVPVFKELTVLTIPDIQGGDDEPLSEQDRAAIDAMERTHDQNQDTAYGRCAVDPDGKCKRDAKGNIIWLVVGNDQQMMRYLLYYEERIAYYANPQIKCPEAEPTPEITPDIPHFVPGVPDVPGEQFWKRNDVQINPETGASSNDPAIVDLPGSPPPEPPAEPTAPADEPY